MDSRLHVTGVQDGVEPFQEPVFRHCRELGPERMNPGGHENCTESGYENDLPEIVRNALLEGRPQDTAEIGMKERERERESGGGGGERENEMGE